jgi:hypothetical protein
MQSTQSTQSSSNLADSVKNKELLWTTLQESGAFAGLTMDQFQPVQSAFDRVVQQAARSSMSLSDTNKHIIREFMQVLRSANANANMPNANTPNANMPNANMPNANTANNATKKKKIEMVYRADDLKTERANEFERQLREKQAEMDSFLTLKKPTDVSFTDAVDEDKPIGDEMSRLIAQELAARERELVQLKPEDIKKAQQWIGTDNNAPNVAPLANVVPLANVAPPPPTVVKKSVSFSNTFSNMMNVVEEHEFGNNDESNGENFEETDSIFSKFKKISEPLPEPNASVSIQQLYNKILELEQNVNAKHAEIMEHFFGKGGVIGAQCLAP